MLSKSWITRGLVLLLTLDTLATCWPAAAHVLEFRQVLATAPRRADLKAPQINAIVARSADGGSVEKSTKSQIWYLLSNTAAMSIDHVSDATVIVGPTGGSEIRCTLPAPAGARLGALSRQVVGQRLAIMIDGKVYMAPLVRDPIGARIAITGSFTRAEAESLARLLKSGQPDPIVPSRND